MIVRLARYGHQQIWPDGMLNAPRAEVVEVNNALAELLDEEKKKK